MTLTPDLILLVLAVICFAVAIVHRLALRLIATGLIFMAVSMLIPLLL